MDLVSFSFCSRFRISWITFAAQITLHGYATHLTAPRCTCAQLSSLSFSHSFAVFFLRAFCMVWILRGLDLRLLARVLSFSDSHSFHVLRIFLVAGSFVHSHLDSLRIVLRSSRTSLYTRVYLLVCLSLHTHVCTVCTPLTRSLVHCVSFARAHALLRSRSYGSHAYCVCLDRIAFCALGMDLRFAVLGLPLWILFALRGSLDLCADLSSVCTLSRPRARLSPRVRLHSS